MAWIRIDKPTWAKAQMRGLNGKGQPVTQVHDVLNGEISARQIIALLLDDYQRPLQPQSYLDAMAPPILRGTIAAVTVGCRSRKGQRKSDENGDYVLIDGQSFLIDGKQRRAITEQMLGAFDAWAAQKKTWDETNASERTHRPPAQPKYGDMLVTDDFTFVIRVFFGTTPDWERLQFHDMNGKQRQVDRNLLVRNARHDPAQTVLQAIWNLTTEDEAFPLSQLIFWGEKLPGNNKGIPVITLLRMLVILYRNFGVRQGTSEMARALQDLAQTVDPDHAEAGSREGVAVIVENLRAFVSLMDASFELTAGLKAGRRGTSAPQCTGTFLTAVALVLGTYPRFWNEFKLEISKAVQADLSTLNLGDPILLSHARANSMDGVRGLARIMVECLNGKKKTNKLELDLLDQPSTGFEFLRSAGEPAA